MAALNGEQHNGVKGGGGERGGAVQPTEAQGSRTRRAHGLVKLSATQADMVTNTVTPSHPLFCSMLFCVEQNSETPEKKILLEAGKQLGYKGHCGAGLDKRGRK